MFLLQAFFSNDDWHESCHLCDDDRIEEKPSVPEVFVGENCPEQTQNFLTKIGVTDLDHANGCCKSKDLCYRMCGSDLEECDILFHTCIAEVAAENCEVGDHYCWVKSATAKEVTEADVDVFVEDLDKSYGCGPFRKMQETYCKCY